MYEDGYLRTSSEAFTLDVKSSRPGGADAKMVHLTNYCMQKHSKNIGRFEEGNTLGYDQLQVLYALACLACRSLPSSALM